MNQLAVRGSTSAIAEASGMSLAEAFVTIDLMVMIDVSGSMNTSDASHGSKRVTRKELANLHLARLQQKHNGKIGVIAFADRAEYLPGGNIEGVHLGSGTNMLEGLLLAKTAADAGINLAMISDGEPNYDIAEKTINLAKKLTVPIHCIYVGREGGLGLEYLHTLAQAAGHGGTAKKSSATGGFGQELNDVILLLK